MSSNQFHSGFIRVFKPTGEIVYCTSEEVFYETLEDIYAEGPRLRALYPDCLILFDYSKFIGIPDDEENTVEYQEVWVDAKQRFQWIGEY